MKPLPIIDLKLLENLILLRDKKNLKVKVTEKERALKNHVKSFEVSIISRRDATKQLYYTSTDVARVLEDNLFRDKGIKVNVNLKILMKKKQIDVDGEVYFIYKGPYFRCKTYYYE